MNNVARSVGYQAEWIGDEGRFHALAEPWERLAQVAGTPFSLHRWYAAWWDAFGAGSALRVLALWEGEELVAALPLCGKGGEIRFLSNAQTPVVQPLHRDAEALDALANEAIERCGQAVLGPLPEEDPGSRRLLDAARDAGRLVVLETGQASPFVAIEGSWEEYRAKMKRRWGSVERKGRKMAREYEATFTMVEPPTDLGAQLERGFAVEASGWKGRAGTAILSAPETERFYRAIARAYADARELAISEILLDGRCVAFDLAILHRRRLYSLKTGFDEQFSTLSPGLVMRRAMIERCFEQGFEVHELLGENFEWKRRFSTGDRPHFTLQLNRRTPPGVARFAYRKLLRPRLRSIYRALPQRS
jgi:CelD/BcsL family acetyltransferase involved in cellulose biosynthesis